MFIKIIFIALILCFAVLILRKYAPEFVLPAELIFLSFAGVYILSEITDKINDIISAVSLSSLSEDVFLALLKGAAVCIFCKLSSDVCSENGNIVFSGIIDLAGKTALLIVAFPFIKSIINTAFAFVK